MPQAPMPTPGDEIAGAAPQMHPLMALLMQLFGGQQPAPPPPQGPQWAPGGAPGERPQPPPNLKGRMTK